MKPVAILGAAGAIGSNLAKELAGRNRPFVAVGRGRKKLEERFGDLPGASLREADLSTEEGARTACEGAEEAVYCVGVPYTNFELHPRLMESTLAGAAAAGVRKLVVISNVYGYGVPQTARVTEEHPRNPVAKKGAFRKQQEDMAIGADSKNGMRTLVLHLPDFYGPFADLSLAHLIFSAAVEGKPANWLGDPKLPHEFVFVPDVPPVILALLAREDVWGERFHLGGISPISGEEFIRAVYFAAIRKSKYRTAGRTLLRLMGLFDGTMRELVEMQYLMETPVILEDSKLQARIGAVAKTPYPNGIVATLAHLRGIPSLA